MQGKVRRILITIGILLVMVSGIQQLSAQEVQDNRWSLPYRLSTDEGQASSAFMLSDQYGLVHVFWVETGYAQNRDVIQYAYFDGRIWTGPLDIYITGLGQVIGDMSPTIDKNGRLHLIWTEGNSGPVYYISAPVFETMSARSWSIPVRIDIPAFRVQLEVDDAGFLHLIYSDYYGKQPGVFYTHSQNEGEDWSEPVWLDPDIPPNHSVGWLRLTLDDRDGLHLVWTYFDLKGGISNSVRYIRSLDRGNTWEPPFFIDIADETPDELRMPNPDVRVIGDTVHVIYAGDSMTHREHRLSTDRGQTWGDSVPIFGDMHGQAIGDGLAIDANGRLHFAGQIRYPQGVWHAYWDEAQWHDLALLYWFDPTVDYVGAHNVRTVMRSGNQLVVTFTDAPSDPEKRLFAMVRTLDDVPALPAEPKPEPTSTPTPANEQVVVTVLETPMPTRVLLSADASTPTSVGTPSPGSSIWMGIVPAILMIGLAFSFHIAKRR